MKKIIKKQVGFTLLELLIVISIITIITILIFLTLDPIKRFRDARNAKRQQDIVSIAKAIRYYQLKNNQFPSGIDSNWRMLGTDATGCDIACGNTSSFSDDTQSEFDNGTYSNTQWDSGNSWVELNATGQSNGSGTYTSSIKGAGVNVSWTNISWNPEYPYYKELPNNMGSESGYNNGNLNMSGNVLLLHMNESSGIIQDSSGNNNNGVNNGATYGVTGKLNTAMDFDGSNDTINITESTPMNFTSAVSYGAWFKADTISTWTGIISRMKSWPNGYNLQVGTSNKIACGWGTYTSSDNTPVTGRWYHAVCVYDGSQMKLYVDGVVQSDVDSGTLNASTDPMKIGAFYTTPSLFFDGQIDEVFVFNKALTASEILNMYRRGALRLKYQVRSCNDDLCSGESFVGPNGSISAYYTELLNSTTGLPSLSLSGLSDNQYFQYRVSFETDNSSYTPELNSVDLSNNGDGGGAILQSACLDIANDLSEQLPAMPKDPLIGSVEKTYYAVKKIASGKSKLNLVKQKMMKT